MSRTYDIAKNIWGSPLNNNLFSRTANNSEQVYETEENQPDNSAKQDAGQEENKSGKKYNPFLNKNGDLVNPYIDYDLLLDSNNLGKVTKNFLRDALGMPEEENTVTYAKKKDESSEQPENFDGTIDADSLGKMDMINELPKLSVKQIGSIITEFFGDSSVISASDAQGIYEAQSQSGISALAILGIGAHESAYGTSNIAKQKGNLWGYGAVNSNPMGGARSYGSVSSGAAKFANEFKNTYYNKYGANSIYSAGTGNNPAGMGYAYYDGGGINPTWATDVSGIMAKFYNYIGGSSGYLATKNGGSNSIVDEAKKYLGTKYVWGGTSPSGFDCSGLVQYVYARNGKSIPRVASDQFKSGTAVSAENLQPGDLVFFKGYKKSSTDPGHVGIYVGNGQYLHAPKTGDVVKISNLSSRSDYVGARRY